MIIEDLKVGEYVRTIDGYIARIVTHDPEFIHTNFDDTVKKSFEEEQDWFMYDSDYDTITKHSMDIAEIVEVGDYVNGRQIVSISKDLFNKGKINLWTNEFETNNFGDYAIIKFTSKQIKTILTKERYKQNCYNLERE